DAMLIEKDSTGLFGLTALGEIVLTLLPSMNFLALHKDYFMSHEVMSRLPHELVRRIGELQESIYLEKVGSVLALAQKVVQEAEEYIWLMADHILQGDQFLVGSNKLETSNVAWKIIVPAESNIDWNLLRRTVGINKGKMEFFLLEDPKDVCAAIAMNEKIAGWSFPDAKGRLDSN